MQLTELESILRKTYEDHRLSRSEKTALAEVLKDVHNEDTLRFVRNKAFDIARESLKDQASNRAVDWLEEIVKVVDTQRQGEEAVQIAGFFSPGDACLDCIVQAIRKARYTIDICVYTITDDRVKHAILDAFKKGVKIRVITDDEKSEDPGSDIVALNEAGIEIAIDGWEERMHHKFAVFDGKELATGSYNWTRSAAAHNYENVVMTNDHKLVAAFLTEFERLWGILPRL